MELIHQRHGQTDRRTDDMRSQYRALHYSASRGKNVLIANYLAVVLTTHSDYCLPNVVVVPAVATDDGIAGVMTVVLEDLAVTVVLLLVLVVEVVGLVVEAVVVLSAEIDNNY